MAIQAISGGTSYNQSVASLYLTKAETVSSVVLSPSYSYNQSPSAVNANAATTVIQPEIAELLNIANTTNTSSNVSGASNTAASSITSTLFDVRDTNQDGYVSVAEILAYAFSNPEAGEGEEEGAASTLNENTNQTAISAYQQSTMNSMMSAMQSQFVLFG